MGKILVKPVITEKYTKIAEQLSQYSFVVDKKANKLQIKNAVEKFYGVSVTDVNTMVIPGKEKTRYTKNGFNKGMKSSYKRAVVTLKDGDSIDFYSNV